ncbi:hypothetical protein ACFU98_15080 [Streptomyces sp. NPDC057575]|uniref:hypothetical protein n=1 Tax=unclassified Streptomyces TaxID=2593676 RepID=UPI0036C6D9A2
MRIRTLGTRLRRGVMNAVMAAAPCGPDSAAARPRTPAPAPAALPGLSADTPDVRYAAGRGNIAGAAEMAKAACDVRRERAPSALAAAGR